MSRERAVAAEDIIEGDIVDIAPLLDDPKARAWVFQPFGPNDEHLAEAIESARMTAECEYATADASKVDEESGMVQVYTDAMNFVVPPGYQITVANP